MQTNAHRITHTHTKKKQNQKNNIGWKELQEAIYSKLLLCAELTLKLNHIAQEFSRGVLITTINGDATGTLGNLSEHLPNISVKLFSLCKSQSFSVLQLVTLAISTFTESRRRVGLRRHVKTLLR